MTGKKGKSQQQQLQNQQPLCAPEDYQFTVCTRRSRPPNSQQKKRKEKLDEEDEKAFAALMSKDAGPQQMLADCIIQRIKEKDSEVASGTCSLREAHIIGSIIKRGSIPPLHSGAASMMLAVMEYSGTTRFWKNESKWREELPS